jgi:hypothetical protein
MSEPSSQFAYYRGPDARCFVPVCSVVTSKSTNNVYYERHKLSGDRRQRQILRNICELW